jgi:hypothetical protein
MNDLPEKWRAYARVQSRLARRRCLNSVAWGDEQSLNQELDALASGESSDAELNARSAARRERARNAARRDLPPGATVPSPPQVHEAYEDLSEIQGIVTPRELVLLMGAALGCSGSELARQVPRCTIASARKIVSRARAKLRHLRSSIAA